jgi:hypothetical protein
MNVQELRQFILEASAELRAIDAELQPVKQREREIRGLMAETSIAAEAITVQSTVWRGRCACGERSLGYARVTRTVRKIDHAGRLLRQDIFEELLMLAENFGPLRERRRTLYADIDAARRAIDRIEEARANPPKPKSRSGNGQLSLI